MTLFQDVAEHFLSTPAHPCLQPTLPDLLIAVSRAIDLLEGRPWRHGVKVAVIAGTLGKTMGLTDRELTAVVYAGLLHDVGLAKVAWDLSTHLPADTNEKQLFYSHTLLNSGVVGLNEAKHYPAQLQTILQRHPKAAMPFMESLFLPAEVHDIVLAHHELWDGSGYPLGLSRHEIPMGAHIVAFADTIEAILQEVVGLEPRRQALQRYLESNATRKFCPEVIEALEEVLRDDAFLRQLYSLEVEAQIHHLVNHRAMPVSGKMLLDAAKAMSQLADGLTPPYTAQHAARVTDLSTQMAIQMGIPMEQIGELVLASLLHDIGKLAIPVNILRKEAPLTSEEWDIIHTHPHYTEEVLKNIPGFGNVALWASEHHERMNAQGYPGRRKSTEISVGGRIIALADVFEAMTAKRPYREVAYEAVDVLPLMLQGRYRMFDSKLLDVLRAVVLQQEVVFQ